LSESLQAGIPIYILYTLAVVIMFTIWSAGQAIIKLKIKNQNAKLHIKIQKALVSPEVSIGMIIGEKEMFFLLVSFLTGGE